MRDGPVLKGRYLKECGYIICGDLGILAFRKLTYSIS